MFDNGRRKFDARGRLCIPKNIREVYNLENSPVDIFTENDLIIISKASVHAEEFQQVRSSAWRYSQGASFCNFCLCSSCTSFGCPHAFAFGKSKTDGTLPDRCYKCQDKNIGRIRDCDFYTPKKRKKFYRYKPKKRETFRSVILRELGELKRLLGEE